MKKSAILGRLLMFLGGLLVLSGMLLLGYNCYLEYTAGKASDDTLLAVQQEIEQNQAEAEGEQQEIKLDDTQYLGVLSIPKLDLVLPVQAKWDYKKLRNTPCVYTGSIQDGDLVILAHNYKRHFGTLNQLRQGDEISLTDAEGKQFQYLVDELLVLDAVNVDEMIDSGYDLSLFTCTYGGKARITVRCTLQNEVDRYPILEEY